MRTVHLSTGSTVTSKLPMFTMGSMVKIIPALSRSPTPRLPKCLTWGVVVELAPDAVSDVVAHDAAPFGLDELLDGRPDVSEPRPLAHLGDADLEGLARRLDEVAGPGARGADVERGRGVAVEAVVDGRHVDVDDVSVPQHLRPGMPWQTTSLIEVQTLLGKPR